MVIIGRQRLEESQRNRYYYDNSTSQWFGVHRLNDDGEIVLDYGVDEEGRYFVDVLREGL